MLLFGLFKRKRLFDRLSCPRLDAESPTLGRGLCWYVVPISHDILIYHGLYFGIIIIWNFPMKYELVHSFWNLRRQLPLWTRVLKSLSLGADFVHKACVSKPLSWRVLWLLP